MPVANFALMFLCHRKNCFQTHKISRLRKKFRLSTHTELVQTQKKQHFLRILFCKIYYFCVAFLPDTTWKDFYIFS